VSAVRLGRGFEWFVAWRHLRDPERKSRRLLKVGVALMLVSAAAYLGLDYALQHRITLSHAPS
jgi:hypothetical protein